MPLAKYTKLNEILNAICMRDYNEMCFILAGGFGTRISEETDLKPKPMTEIGGMPLLWHLMKIINMKLRILPLIVPKLRIS